MGEPQLGADLVSYLGLKPIYFDLNQDMLRPDTSETLEKVIAVMERYPE